VPVDGGAAATNETVTWVPALMLQVVNR
jgi:hypothetical protein